MKTITITIDSLRQIDAFDNDGQSIRVVRMTDADSELSDNDPCECWSRLEGDKWKGVKGTLAWHESFTFIMDRFNCTSLDTDRSI